MKRILIITVLFMYLTLTSCAMVFSPKNPDINRDQFAGLIEAGSDRTACYEKGFRGGMLLMDIIFGAPFAFVPVIIDAATGSYTAYYYHHKKCEQLKAEVRSARHSEHTAPAPIIQLTTSPIVEKDPPLSPQPLSKSAPDSLPVVQTEPVSKAPAPKPVPAVEPATVPEPAPAPTSQPQVEEDPEYDILF